jgi:hypothetical protein
VGVCVCVRDKQGKMFFRDGSVVIHALLVCGQY